MIINAELFLDLTLGVRHDNCHSRKTTFKISIIFQGSEFLRSEILRSEFSRRSQKKKKGVYI